MKISPLLVATVLMASISCKSSKETTQQESTTAPVNYASEEAPATNSNIQTSTIAQHQPMEMPAGSTGTQQNKDAQTCRINISFISIGAGTDLKAREIMDGVVKNWEGKKAKKLAMESIPWGREGEVDFCFTLNELNASEQAAFVKEMRTAFTSHELIQITENQASIHKR